MEIITTILLVGLLMLISFNMGAKKGVNTIDRTKGPIERIKEAKEERKKERERKEIELREREIEEINLYNIEIYDGTSAGQKSFPGGN